jgi:hypothetical protein
VQASLSESPRRQGAVDESESLAMRPLPIVCWLSLLALSPLAAGSVEPASKMLSGNSEEDKEA